MKIEIFDKKKKAIMTQLNGKTIPMLYASALQLMKNQAEDSVSFHKIVKYGPYYREVVEQQNKNYKIIKYCTEF